MILIPLVRECEGTLNEFERGKSYGLYPIRYGGGEGSIRDYLGVGNGARPVSPCRPRAAWTRLDSL